MGRAIAVRAGYTSGELRRLAKQSKNVAQARRLLAIAAVPDCESREEAARTGGMNWQTLRDWVMRFDEGGPGRLLNLPAPGARAKMNCPIQSLAVQVLPNRRQLIRNARVACSSQASGTSF